MLKFIPKRFKYKHTFFLQKFKKSIDFLKKNQLQFYQYGLISNENIFLYKEEVFSIYKFLKKNLKKKTLFRFHLDFINTYTSKSIGMRMGKGKGPRRFFFAKLLKGQIFLEICVEKKFNYLIDLELKQVLKNLKKRISFKSNLIILKY